MSAALPLHVATADEPIQPFRKDGPWNCPDMREVKPLETMLAELAHVGDDDVEFVALFRVFVREIGCSVLAHYHRDGELGLNAGYPCDPQSRHRNRWMHYLIDRLDAVEGRRELLLRTLIHAGQCWDERPADPRETTKAMRDFLQVGGRLLMDPEGRLGEGSEVPLAFISGTDEETERCAAASRAYFKARRRLRADRQIKRAVRMLGARTDNGWIVLEASAR